MRHGNKVNHLSRTTAHRDALLMNLSNALITHKRIVTTLAKAKELRKHVEPLITKSKTDTTHSRRTVFTYLKDKLAVKELFGVVAPKIGDRPGGYLRILKLGPRKGDNTEMALIEMVDFNEYITETKARGRRKPKRKPEQGASKVQESTVAESKNDTVVEAENNEAAE